MTAAPAAYGHSLPLLHVYALLESVYLSYLCCYHGLLQVYALEDIQ